MTATKPTKARNTKPIDGILCRDCKGTGYDRKLPIACNICQGAKVIDWTMYESALARAQELACDLQAAAKREKGLRSQLKALQAKHADIDDVVDDYLAGLAQQTNANAKAAIEFREMALRGDIVVGSGRLVQ